MTKEVSAVELEIYRTLFKSIADEMGTVLKRTAYSPNIKERRDYSCAVFDAQAEVVAMGDHMPVHLGSMPMSVQTAVKSFELQPGDVVILNDPYDGGTHLPDITLIMPVFPPRRTRPCAYVASRAHHSDVGGMSPGSMPLSQEIFQEGIRIPPVKLYREGELNQDLLKTLLYNVRTPVEREGDLAAQLASLRVGEKRLLELIERNDLGELTAAMQALQTYAQRVSEALLESIPDGSYKGEDHLDDDGAGGSDHVKIALELRVENNRLTADFSQSDPQVKGCLNAVEAITTSAVNYVIRCLAPPDTPSAAGLMRPVKVVAPEGTIVNARFPAATAAGNVETSQRIVDVVLRAFAEAIPDVIPAASSGTMNNLTVGGLHPANGEPFSYYETMGGGMGAGPKGDGDSGIHTHMTNSLNTPVEALERYFPFRIREYRMRSNSGGRGEYNGGDGLVRSIEFLSECQITILSERRKTAPYGLKGGRNGKRGSNQLVLRGRRKRLPGKASTQVMQAEVLMVETPGGGGWGRKKKN